MIAVIAEKPSVARDLARILGATTPESGYVSGNGYLVTWAFGHLISLAKPTEYGINTQREENIPFTPEKFKLVVRSLTNPKTKLSQDDPSAIKQLKIIKDIFDKCDKIIVATDAGREGELIFRYIYHYLNCTKPFVRLWISSLTDKAIRDGLNRLKPGAAFDNLFYAGQARSQSDWLIGLNASASLTLKAKNGHYSLGRVQTPTLKMICERFLLNKNFVATPYWELEAQTYIEDKLYKLLSLVRYDSLDKAQDALNQIESCQKIIIDKVESKSISTDPPLLYDLTALQKDANKKYGFSAKETLEIAQVLYEKKLTTYPRTGSRYIPEDVFEEMGQRVLNLISYKRFEEYARELQFKKLNKKSVDNNKITDHHALITTENSCKVETLERKETIIYELIAGRMLEALSDKSVKEVTGVRLLIKDIPFSLKGCVIKKMGWKAVWKDKEDEEETIIPALKENDELLLKALNLLAKETKPKPLHTEASLLDAMETAGKELEDDQEKEALKECGLGTPATRASIIETLLIREYIIKEKKSLVPTKKGLSVYDIVKDLQVSNVAMTGKWENLLGQVEKGLYDIAKFNEDIINVTKQITDEILNCNIQIPIIPSTKIIICPRCKSEMKNWDKNIKCTNENCKLNVWKEVARKTLNEKQLSDLLRYKKTELIKGFKNKEGSTWSAKIILNEKWEQIFEFEAKQKAIVKEETTLLCPKCKKGTIVILDKYTKCDACDFKIWNTIAGVNLIPNQIKDLIAKGKTEKITGFKKAKDGTLFDTSLVLTNEFKVIFEKKNIAS